MKNSWLLFIVSAVILSLTTVCCKNSNNDAEVYKRVNDTYSKERVYPYLYYVDDYGYATFERYMWDRGFPDTLIVRFTRNGEFEGYVEAVRQGVLKDSLGNHCSPTYVFVSGVGDSWTYDIDGRFLEFNCVDLPHSGQPHTYHP